LYRDVSLQTSIPRPPEAVQWPTTRDRADGVNLHSRVKRAEPMTQSMTRRDFVTRSGAAVAGAAMGAQLLTPVARAANEPLFRISLAEWSLHRALDHSGKDNLTFAARAKNDFGIDAIEFVNQFFMDKARDKQYLAELKKRSDDLGVRNLLIMCDREGRLGDPDDAKRTQAVENHYKWVEAAKFLGCHSIRVNAASAGEYQEQLKRAADGLRRLSEFGDQHGINVIVENHGGLSSNGQWLAAVMKTVDHPRCGTLPDFGNFGSYDRYKGVTELMPFAKAVSAKSHDFDDKGNETHTDYVKMIKIVLDGAPKAWEETGRYVGVEYEGRKTSETDGIKATKHLLERVREQLA